MEIEEKIRTRADRMLEIVSAKSSVRLSEVAEALAMTPDQAEKIALLLEQNGLLEVRYGLLDVSLSLPGQIRREAGAETARAENEAVRKSRELEFAVMTSENLLEFFEKEVEKRFSAAKALLAELKKREFTAAELAEVERELDLAIGQLNAFSREIEELNAKEREFLNELSKFRKEIESLKPAQETKQDLVKEIAKIIPGLPPGPGDLRKTRATARSVDSSEFSEPETPEQEEEMMPAAEAKATPSGIAGQDGAAPSETARGQSGAETGQAGGALDKDAQLSRAFASLKRQAEEGGEEEGQ